MNENVNIQGTKTSSLNGLENVALYFIGIGGIGMSAIARYFQAKGVEVSGYDKTKTDLTIQLEAEGTFSISIFGGIAVADGVV